jgi:hypothetical protein
MGGKSAGACYMDGSQDMKIRGSISGLVLVMNICECIIFS